MKTGMTFKKKAFLWLMVGPLLVMFITPIFLSKLLLRLDKKGVADQSIS